MAPNSPGGLSQLSQALSAGKLGAGLLGDKELSGDFGTVGNALGAGRSAYNIMQGNGSLQDYMNLAKGGYQLGTQAGLIGGGETAGAGGAAGSSLVGSSGSAATGAGAAGAEAGSSGAASGLGAASTGIGVVMLAKVLGDMQTARQAQEQAEGAQRTVGRLNDIGVNWGDLAPEKFLSVVRPYEGVSSQDLLSKYGGYTARAGSGESPDIKNLSDWARSEYAPRTEINRPYLNNLMTKYPEMASSIGMHDLTTDFPLIYKGAPERLTAPYQNEFSNWLNFTAPAGGREEQSGG